MTLIAAFAFLAAAPQDDSAAKIRDLVRQLGAEEYAAREKASEELRKIGRPAEEALRKAAESEDPEVRSRAKSLLEELSKPKAPEVPRRPGRPGAFGLRGGSVSVSSVNGDTTYTLTPADGSPGITFFKSASGAVRLDYKDEQGAAKSAEADSIAKFLKDHADLAAKHGITEDGIDHGGVRVSFKGNGLPGLPRGLRLPRFPKGFPFEEELEEAELRASGAVFEKPGDALRAQLELPEGQGLVVLRTDAGGAAAQAGLRKSDILLEVDGRKVASMDDVKSLKDATSLVVVRKARRETLTR
jgi:hypothetical protein